MLNFLIIAVAKWLIIVPPLLTLVVLWQLKTKSLRLRYLILVVGTGLFALALASISGSFIDDARPFVVGHFTPLIPHAADNGFPSDHTLLAAALGFAALAFSRKYGIVILILAVLIGAARVAAGVHHVEDIVGSFIISAIAFGIVLGLERVAFRRKPTNEDAA